MILCVGTSGSGKSVLLRYLLASESSASSSSGSSSKATNNNGMGDNKTMVNSIPTAGTNLVTLTKSRSLPLH